MIRESRSNRSSLRGGPATARRTALKAVGALLGAALVLSAVIAPASAVEETRTLTSVRGSVSMQLSGSNDWVPAGAGAQLAEGTRVVAAEGANATITIGDGAIVELGEQTEVVIGGEGLPLADGSAVLLQHVEGHIELKLRLKAHHYLKDTPTVVTPHAAVCMQTQMRFQNIKVTVGPDSTLVAVVQGEAEVVADGSAITVQAGQWATAAAAGPSAVEEATPGAGMDMVVVAGSDPVAERSQSQERTRDGDQDQARDGDQDRDRDRDRDQASTGECEGCACEEPPCGEAEPNGPNGPTGPNGDGGPAGEESPNGPNGDGQNGPGGPNELRGPSEGHESGQQAGPRGAS